MTRSPLVPFLAGAAVAGLVLTSATAIAAAGQAVPTGPYDGRAPVLRVKPIAFVTGAQIDAAIPFDPEDCDIAAWHTAVPMRLAWVGRDQNEPLASFDLWAIPSSDEPDQVLDDSPLTRYEVLGGNYDGSCGDAATNTTYRVETVDEVGNAAQVLGDTGVYMGVWQEDGSTVPSIPPGSVTMSGTGAWSQVICGCSDAGATFSSTTAGDSATYEVTSDHTGQRFALVMPTGADRGEVTITFDDEAPVTLDTWSAKERHRVIVWQKRLAQGVHTITITNLGTEGRSKVDIDAVMLS